MLEVYIATDSATDSINLRHCSKAMLPISLNFVLPAVQAFFSGAWMFFSQKRHVESRKARRKWGESKGTGKGGGGGGGGGGEGREKKKTPARKHC